MSIADNLPLLFLAIDLPTAFLGGNFVDSSQNAFRIFRSPYPIPNEIARVNAVGQNRLDVVRVERLTVQRKAEIVQPAGDATKRDGFPRPQLEDKPDGLLTLLFFGKNQIDLVGFLFGRMNPLAVVSLRLALRHGLDSLLRGFVFERPKQMALNVAALFGVAERRQPALKRIASSAVFAACDILAEPLDVFAALLRLDDDFQNVAHVLGREVAVFNAVKFAARVQDDAAELEKLINVFGPPAIQGSDHDALDDTGLHRGEQRLKVGAGFRLVS